MICYLAFCWWKQLVMSEANVLCVAEKNLLNTCGAKSSLGPGDAGLSLKYNGEKSKIQCWHLISSLSITFSLVYLNSDQQKILQLISWCSIHDAIANVQRVPPIGTSPKNVYPLLDLSRQGNPNDVIHMYVWKSSYQSYQEEKLNQMRHISYFIGETC